MKFKQQEELLLYGFIKWFANIKHSTAWLCKRDGESYPASMWYAALRWQGIYYTCSTADCFLLQMLSGRIQDSSNSKWKKKIKLKNKMFAVQHNFLREKLEIWIKWGISVDLIASKSWFDSIRFLAFCLLQLQNTRTEVLPQACIRID